MTAPIFSGTERRLAGRWSALRNEPSRRSSGGQALETVVPIAIGIPWQPGCWPIEGQPSSRSQTFWGTARRSSETLRKVDQGETR